MAGKTDREQFGGPLASTMEELKAQSAALYFTDWLAEKKLITQDQSNKAHVRDLMWSFGHISRGMYGENKAPKNYSQLAAIQLGILMRGGTVTWKKDVKAANGTDQVCFSVDLKKYPVAVKAMMKLVAGIKSRGDKAGVEKLIAEDVDVTGEQKALYEVITERALRGPKASFGLRGELVTNRVFQVVTGRPGACPRRLRTFHPWLTVPLGLCLAACCCRWGSIAQDQKGGVRRRIGQVGPDPGPGPVRRFREQNPSSR